MSESVVRHLIAIFGTLASLAIFLGGYSAARNGWWWLVFGLVVVYIIIYRLVDA